MILSKWSIRNPACLTEGSSGFQRHETLDHLETDLRLKWIDGSPGPKGNKLNLTNF